VITEFPVPTVFNGLHEITKGSDGNLWSTDYAGQAIWRITTAGASTRFPVPTGSPYGITAGPDGNLWFTELFANQIGRITTAGVITEFPIPTSGSGPFGITAGPDGNLWFTTFVNNVDRITTAGVITEFPIPTTGSTLCTSGFPLGTCPEGITAGPDGNLWFVEAGGNNVGRITPAGVITEFPIPTVGSSPGGITAGPDGSLWFTEEAGNKIGKITLASGSGAALTVFPNRGTNSGPINVVLAQAPGTSTSVNLSGAQVKLSGAGLPNIPGTNIANPSMDILTATFDLTGAMPGPRDVVITPESGAPVTLNGAFTILPTPGCSYTVAPLNPSFPASGGIGEIVVTSNVNTAACNFHMLGSFPTNVDWIIPVAVPPIVIGGTGLPAEGLVYDVAVNSSPNSRNTTVSIFSQNVTISQAGTSTCSYNVSPTSKIFPASGGAFDINVFTSSGCAWSASSSLSWVHVTAGSSGSGNGVVRIMADPDTGGLRSGSITIAGKPFSVSQGADACGASDVSSQIAVGRGPILQDFIGGTYDETITLRNNGSTVVPSPVFLVLDGLPVTGSQCGTFLGQNQTCSVTPAPRLTFCQSPSGSDMVLFAPGGLTPGQAVTATLTFVPGPAGGAKPPVYTTRVFSGTPNK
jgi:streptogramin lyase